MERNTSELVRKRDKRLISFTVWTSTFIGAIFLVGFLILAHILGWWWTIPTLIGCAIYTATTTHGIRHGWLK
jgi:hypothetical protein